MAFPAGWSYRCPIVIDADQVDDALTDWPLLLTEANLPPEIFSDAKADGSDIRASSDEAGTAELAVQVVSFDPGGTAEIWIKVPSVSAVADTTIYLWFGNAEATLPAADSAFGSEAVWTNGYAAVWHLDEYSDESGDVARLDSCADNHLADQNTCASTAGIVGRASSHVRSRVESLLLPEGNPVNPGLGDFSITGWVYGISATGPRLPFRCNGDVGYLLFGYVPVGTNINASFNDGSSTVSTPSVAMPLGEWHFVAVTLDRDGLLSLSIDDGTPVTADVSSMSAFDCSGGTTMLSSQWNGHLDEFAAFNRVLAPAWIAADYRSQSSPGTFAVAGTVEEVGGGAIVPSLGGRFFRRGSTPQFIGAMAFRR